MARAVSAGSARSTWMWSSGPASHGQSSGKAWREQVMTRQPAEEKRIAVAWPMPRLAPVRRSVRRGALDGGDMEVFQAVVIITDRGGPWTRLALTLRGGIRCGRAGGRGGRARTRNAVA